MQSNRRAKRTNRVLSVGDRRGQLLKRGVLAVIALTFSVSAGFARSAEDAPAPNRPIRDKWALVVGISEFENPKLNLRYSAKDAADFASYLTNSAGFAPDHVKILLNKDATQRRILSEL
ncbi:MAG: caspase family protein, partial [Candidatus Obscuribacterales bacterium]